MIPFTEDWDITANATEDSESEAESKGIAHRGASSGQMAVVAGLQSPVFRLRDFTLCELWRILHSPSPADRSSLWSIDGSLRASRGPIEHFV